MNQHRIVDAYGSQSEKTNQRQKAIGFELGEMIAACGCDVIVNPIGE